MFKLSIVALAVASIAAGASAQTRTTSSSINIRFSEQISNGPAGSCGCFTMQGAAGDFAGQMYQFGHEHTKSLVAVADISVEHTGSVNEAPYGLTLTTIAFGPRFVGPAPHHSQFFAQTLFGLAHGSGSQFPVGNTLKTRANSFALDLGAGFEHSLTEHLGARLLQVEYMRTALPNNSSNWQNNLRLSTGITFSFH